MYAHDHDLFFRAFCHPSHTGQANKLIPSWTAAMMPRGGATIFTLYPATLIFALLNFYGAGGRGEVSVSDTARWYGFGSFFTVAHFFFAKWALGLLNAMKDDESKGKATEDMKKWVGMNVLRTLFVDLPGWVCYVVAVTGTLTI